MPPLHLLLLALFFAAAFALPLDFDSDTTLYHDLDIRTLQLVLLNVSLKDEETLWALRGLLNHPLFNFGGLYNKACRAINEERAIEILRLDKDLEMHLLGSACLTNDIIKVRKNVPNMWPPTGLPLLVDGFEPNNIAIDDIKDVLYESLKHPKWWYSKDWIKDVDWERMGDMRFWRLIPLGKLSTDISPYLKKSLLTTLHLYNWSDAKELLMQFIRVLFFTDPNIDEPTALACQAKASLQNLEQHNDPWHPTILALFQNLCTENKLVNSFAQVLLDSKLLYLGTWQEAISAHSIPHSTAINDLLELFTMAIKYSSKESQGAIQYLLEAFLDNLNDLSNASPITLGALFEMRYTDPCWYASFERHTTKLSTDARLIPLLSLSHHATLSTLQNMQFIVKQMEPLLARFAQREAHPSSSFYTYLESLYQKWKQNKEGWPGIITVAKQTNSILEKAFKPSIIEPGVYDPKLDAEHDWNMIFVSIMFKLESGIPNTIVPSLCLFRALLYYQREILDWSRLKLETGTMCSFPDTQLEQGRYLKILQAISDILGLKNRSFSWNDAKNLQTAIQFGVANGATHITDYLTGLAPIRREPTLYSHPRDFYHELCRKRQKEIMHLADLHSQNELRALIRLLSDDTFDIRRIYNSGCDLITRERAKVILNLTIKHPELNVAQILLGVECLSDTIITVRKEHGMWPPNSKATLLPIGLRFTNASTKDVKDILERALYQPQLWQGKEWPNDVNWDQIDDLRFWRMIPIFLYDAGKRTAIYSYHRRSLFSSDYSSMQSVEGLFMKMIRLLYLHPEDEEPLDVRKFLCDGLLDTLAIHKTPWCTEALDVLGKLCTRALRKDVLLDALIDSKLLDYGTWQEAISTGVMSKTFVTNNILELLKVGFVGGFTYDQAPKIINFADAFLNMADLSKASPIAIYAFFGIEAKLPIWHSLLEKYADKLTSHDHHVSALVLSQSSHSLNLKMARFKLKHLNLPLMEHFKAREAYPWHHPSPYIKLLYEEWSRDKAKWPGLVAAHERISGPLREVFKHSKMEPGTWDPKLDVPYDRNAWDLAFLSIRFQGEHGIPETPVLSMCFLKALVYIHKRPKQQELLDWIELEKEAGTKCDLPTDPDERDRYLSALTAANYQFLKRTRIYPWRNARDLQISLSNITSNDCTCTSQLNEQI